MTILQQCRAILVFGGDRGPMVRVSHFAALFSSKPCIGVMGVFGVLGHIGELWKLRCCTVHHLLKAIGKGGSHLGVDQRTLLAQEKGAEYGCIVEESGDLVGIQTKRLIEGDRRRSSIT